MDKLTPFIWLSQLFFSFAASQCRVTTVPEQQNYGRMMDGKTNTSLLWSIRVGFISFNLLPKERNIVWRNIFPASELPPARYQCRGSVCGFLIKPSLLYPSHMVSESGLYFVVSHSPTRSHHHMVIVRPPLLHACISALQSLILSLTSPVRSLDFILEPCLWGTHLTWGPWDHLAALTSSGVSFLKGKDLFVLICRFSVWIPIWKFTFHQSFSVCLQQMRLLQSRTTITDSSHLDFS